MNALLQTWFWHTNIARSNCLNKLRLSWFSKANDKKDSMPALIDYAMNASRINLPWARVKCIQLQYICIIHWGKSNFMAFTLESPAGQLNTSKVIDTHKSATYNEIRFLIIKRVCIKNCTGESHFFRGNCTWGLVTNVRKLGAFLLARQEVLKNESIWVQITPLE